MITLNKYDSPIVACKNSPKLDQPSFMVIQAFDNMQYSKQFKLTWNSISGISRFCFQSYNLGNYILASSSICPILPYTLKAIQLKADQ